MNWVDTPLLVYSAVEGHPARARLAEALARDEWGSTILALFEAYSVLNRDYRSTPQEAGMHAEILLAGPIHWDGFEVAQAEAVLQEQRRHRIAPADAALLLRCREDGGTLYTLDQPLERAGQSEGLATARLLDDALIREVQDWEDRTLRGRGTPRVLDSVHRWLQEQNTEIAEKFLEATGGLREPPTA